MEQLARSMPGFVSFDAYTDASGKRVSIIEFESEDTLRAWRENPEHLDAQQLGRESFYSEYSIEVCEKRRDAHFRFVDDASPRAASPRDRARAAGSSEAESP